LSGNTEYISQDKEAAAAGIVPLMYNKTAFHIMAVDCCEHIIALLSSALPNSFTAVTSKDHTQLVNTEDRISLIAIGLTKYPVRRPFISQLRRIYADVPILILRHSATGFARNEDIRGEFILSDHFNEEDLKIISALRAVMPFKPCSHALKGVHYDLVREVVRIIAEKYPDPHLNLSQVAEELPVSPTYLSRLLNHKVGVSFRQLLRQARIEEAKRMLATRRFSVKEVAARVGFSDSHYFSRSFKELTGQYASEYRTPRTIFS
jgi:AraC-like DNA-binding protein